MSEAPDYLVGEHPDLTTTVGLCQAIDHMKAEGLKGFRELAAERDEAIAERDKARAERDKARGERNDLIAKASWNSGRQL